MFVRILCKKDYLYLMLVLLLYIVYEHLHPHYRTVIVYEHQSWNKLKYDGQRMENGKLFQNAKHTIVNAHMIKEMDKEYSIDKHGVKQIQSSKREVTIGHHITMKIETEMYKNTSHFDSDIVVSQNQSGDNYTYTRMVVLAGGNTDNRVTPSDGIPNKQVVLSSSNLNNEVVLSSGNRVNKEVPPVVNPHYFKYMINNKSICAGVDHLEYIIYVHTGSANFLKRKMLRGTWLQNDLLANRPSRVIFFVGKPYSTTIQNQLYAESNNYGDIVQEDYKDTYRNLTYKGMSAWKWITKFCNKSRFVFKTDDDTFVDIFALTDLLRKYYYNVKRSILGLIMEGTHILRQKPQCGKWCVNYNQLHGLIYYPKYCSGAFFILTGDIISDLYLQSLYTPYFFVDDAFLTGIVPSKMKDVNHIDIGSYYKYTEMDLFRQYAKHDTARRYIVTLTEYHKRLWKSCLLHLPDSSKRQLADGKYDKLKDYVYTH